MSILRGGVKFIDIAGPGNELMYPQNALVAADVSRSRSSYVSLRLSNEADHVPVLALGKVAKDSGSDAAVTDILVSDCSGLDIGISEVNRPVWRAGASSI